MIKIPKKAALIHDMSGLGRCSLTVILPILSALGVQACPVPTAVLSTHTGGYDNMAVVDLTDYIKQALAHYKSLDTDFDCVYSGYLASDRQVDNCLDFFNTYKNALRVVDPVMGDNGKAYKMHTPDLQKRMKELISIADIITPNITEAAMLLDENPMQTSLTEQECKDFLTRLRGARGRTVIITSVFSGGEHYNISYDKISRKFMRVKYNRIDASFPGTGDIFTAILTGLILNSKDLGFALSYATSFLETAIAQTASLLPNLSMTQTRKGISLENFIRTLCDLDSNQDLPIYEEF